VILVKVIVQPNEPMDFYFLCLPGLLLYIPLQCKADLKAIQY
jgi:hypothetical protein